MSEQIPQWAIDRVREIMGYGAESRFMEWPGYDRLARYIAEHEEPPVDPLLIEARKLFAEYHRQGGVALVFGNGGAVGKWGAAEAGILSGEFDHNPTLQLQLAALRRGIEIGKGQS